MIKEASTIEMELRRQPIMICGFGQLEWGQVIAEILVKLLSLTHAGGRTEASHGRRTRHEISVCGGSIVEM